MNASTAVHAYKQFPWTADDQCKMMHGNEVTHCSTLGRDLCETIHCRRNMSSDGCVSTAGMGAIDGTVCGSGKSCRMGSCQPDKHVARTDCPFGDDLVDSDYVSFELPKPLMTCRELLSFAVSTGIDHVSMCKFEYINETCCRACHEFRNETCLDRSINCAKYKEKCAFNRMKINGIFIREYCAFTCQACQSKEVNFFLKIIWTIIRQFSVS